MGDKLPTLRGGVEYTEQMASSSRRGPVSKASNKNPHSGALRVTFTWTEPNFPGIDWQLREELKRKLERILSKPLILLSSETGQPHTTDGSGVISLLAHCLSQGPKLSREVLYSSMLAVYQLAPCEAVTCLSQIVTYLVITLCIYKKGTELYTLKG